MWDYVVDASAWVIPVMLAVMLHEVAHGWVAGRFGDNTARVMGRITLNPLKHVDIFGTILLPVVLVVAHSPLLFGYAKPVPVNFSQLQPPRLGMRVVALAGPVTNLVLALITGLLLHVDKLVTPEQAPWLYLNLYRSLMINCGLAVFNMFPLLPLDGGRVLYSFLSGRLRELFGRIERYGLLPLIAVFLTLDLMGADLNAMLGLPIYGLVELVLAVTGNGNT